MKSRVWIAVCTATVAAGTPVLLAPVVAYAGEPTVQLGNQSSVVKTLQTDLGKLYYFHGPYTGYFGSLTLSAVKSFQQAHHLTTDGIVGPMTWSAIDAAESGNHSTSGSTPPAKPSPSLTNYGLSSKDIVVNGKSVMSIMAFVHNGTTYMPVNSMIEMLKHLNISGTWKNNVWTMTLPSSYKLNLSNIHLTGASSSIVFNGTTVMRSSAISNRDPNNLSVNTDYLPIYYVQQALNRAGIQSTWNGKSWSLATAGTTTSTSPSTPPSAYGLSSKSIVLDGQPLMTIMGYVHAGTTYMPIKSMNDMLKRLDITGTWANGTWSLSIPSTYAMDLSNIKLPGGASTISFNGTPVMKMNTISYHDPDNTSVNTDYAPIYDLQVALKRAGIQYTWNGQTWTIKRTLLPGYTTFSKDGTQLKNYSTEAAAQATIAQSPGATVRDTSGKVVFTEPDFATYDKSRKLIADFTTESAAESALSSTPGGTVKDVNQGNSVVFTEPDYEAYSGPDATGKDFVSVSLATQAISGDSNGYVVDAVKGTVVQKPNNYYYLNSAGNWTSSIYGWQGTVAPNFAQPNAVYLVSDTGKSPYLNRFFLLSDNGQYVGKDEGIFEDPFRTVDLRFPSPSSVTGSQIDNWLGNYNSPLQGLGGTMVEGQNTYGTNSTYLLAHAIEESGWGHSQIAQQKNNLFGYGAYDSNPGPDAGMFPSLEYAVIFQAWEVRNNYLNPGSSHFYESPTLDGMNEVYATGHTWSTTIAALMSQFVAGTSGSISSYQQYNASNNAPVPASTVEPVYQMNGATGIVLSNPYTNLPVYPGPGVGGSDIFPGALSNGSSGPAVVQLQQALNQNGANPQLTTDGAYGPLTETAVKNYQAAHNLPVTGVCSLDVWNSLFPSTGSANVPSLPIGATVTVDQMEQGMDGGLATEWYHVTSGNVSGWVDSSYVQFTNVYRAMASSGYTIPVYGSESTAGTPVMKLHSGDFVVSASIAPDANGFVPVQLVNQTGGSTYTNQGQPLTGYISASAAKLVALSNSSANS